jgi:hypothetical protein
MRGKGSAPELEGGDGSSVSTAKDGDLDEPLFAHTTLPKSVCALGHPALQEHELYHLRIKYQPLRSFAPTDGSPH